MVAGSAEHLIDMVSRRLRTRFAVAVISFAAGAGLWVCAISAPFFSGWTYPAVAGLMVFAVACYVRISARREWRGLAAMMVDHNCGLKERMLSAITDSASIFSEAQVSDADEACREVKADQVCASVVPEKASYALIPLALVLAQLLLGGHSPESQPEAGQGSSTRGAYARSVSPASGETQREELLAGLLKKAKAGTATKAELAQLRKLVDLMKDAGASASVVFEQALTEGDNSGSGAGEGSAGSGRSEIDRLELKTVIAKAEAILEKKPAGEIKISGAGAEWDIFSSLSNEIPPKRTEGVKQYLAALGAPEVTDR
ncbi:MAG: hypothetical protein JXR97_17165 [Planctomycetes bacterium]|nr:hypothetical protein [Planctomycetota bacterium]